MIWANDYGIPDSLETHLQKISQEDECKGLSHIKHQGLDVTIDEWSDLIFPEDVTGGRLQFFLPDCSPIVTLKGGKIFTKKNR